MGSVMAVSGVVGGIGASTLAYAVALHRNGSAVLIDARTTGVPLEVLIGGEQAPGTRWHQVHIANTSIDPAVILTALPKWNGVPFLSATGQDHVHQPAFSHMVSVLREAVELIVIDVDARTSLLGAVEPDVHALLVPNTIYGVAAAAPAITAETALVVARTQLEDFRTDEVERLLGRQAVGCIRFEQAIWNSLRARKPLPTNTSVMQVANQLLMRIANAA